MQGAYGDWLAELAGLAGVVGWLSGWVGRWLVIHLAVAVTVQVGAKR